MGEARRSAAQRRCSAFNIAMHRSEMVVFGLHYFEIGVFTQDPMDEIDMLTCDLGTFHFCTLGGSRLPLALLNARGNGASSFFSEMDTTQLRLQHATLGLEHLIFQQRHPGERYTNTWGARAATREGSKEGSTGKGGVFYEIGTCGRNEEEKEGG